MVKPWHFWTPWLEERKAARVARIADPDAINPALGPFDLLAIPSAIALRDVGFAAIAAAKPATEEMVKAGKAAIAAAKVRQEKPKNFYKTAFKGGKHYGRIKRYKNASNAELEKAIKSYDKQIRIHEEKIKNPQKDIPDFYKFDPRKRRHLLEEKWPKDIRKLKEQKEIMEEIGNERN